MTGRASSAEETGQQYAPSSVENSNSMCIVIWACRGSGPADADCCATPRDPDNASSRSRWQAPRSGTITTVCGFVSAFAPELTRAPS